MGGATSRGQHIRVHSDIRIKEKNQGDTSMSGKFEVSTGKDDKHYFNLEATNGEIVLSSQGYKAEADCMNGIESVRSNCHDSGAHRVNSRDLQPCARFAISRKPASASAMNFSTFWRLFRPEPASTPV